jgi:hypothetical protein
MGRVIRDGENAGNAGMSIKVIGPGFGRTGTDSMREALAILGFGCRAQNQDPVGHAAIW